MNGPDSRRHEVRPHPRAQSLFCWTAKGNRAIVPSHKANAMDQRLQTPSGTGRYSGLAIASLIVALLSFLLLIVRLPCAIIAIDYSAVAGLSSGIDPRVSVSIVVALLMTCVGIVPSVVAVSLGVAGIRRIRKCQPPQKGRGLALAGILIGSAEFVLACGLIVALLVSVWIK